MKSHQHRALIIGSNGLEKDLRVALNAHGYFVEHCKSRLEGMVRFRAYKQALVVLDAEVALGFSNRLFRFFRLVRESTIVLVVAREHETAITKYRLWGAHDVVRPPLDIEALNATLERTALIQRRLIQSVFLKNAAFFALLMFPFWLGLIVLALR